jgi:Na+/serine symporter
VRNGKSLGRNFILGAFSSLLPFILIYLFITQLPAFIPFASSLVPGQTLPSQFNSLVNSIAADPVSGTSSQQFLAVGSTTVNWGFGLGAYLFVAAAAIRIIAGFIIRTTPELNKKASTRPSGPARPVTPSQS